MLNPPRQEMSAVSRLISERDFATMETNRQQQQTARKLPIQQDLLLQQQQQQRRHLLDHRLQQPRHHPRPARETYKSCDFCAKRKRKCSGGVPRCSLCIEKKQPHCHYQLKPSVKARSAKQPAPRWGSSSSTATPSFSDPYGGVGERKRMVDVSGVPVDSADLGVMTVAGVRGGAMVPGSMPLKRCRLSPSPATGLVGLQENVFLSDFFGCLGFLPLATESHIRQAMVEILRAAATPGGRSQLEPQHNQGRFGNGDSMIRAHHGGVGMGGFAAESEETGWGGSSAHAVAAASPATCMMWCAVALGSLVKGAPVENVSEYVRLARESLSECFDGSSVDNARAFATMSFLHGVMNDMEKNDKYLSFATSIVKKLRKEDVPKELGSMLLTIEKMGMFRNPFIRKSGTDVFIDIGSTVEIPSVDNIVQQEDVCNLFLISDRRLKQEFFKDMLAKGAIAGAEAAVEQNYDPDPFEAALQEQRVGIGTVGLRPGEGPRDMGAPPPPPGPRKKTMMCNGWGTRREPPPAGSATWSYVEKTLPEMERLSKMPLRSETFSGVGGLLYHGNVAYMKAVTGELGDSFKSLEACVDVIVRYPGVVRFRTHLVHCTLAASQCNDRPDVYEAVRRVYNSVRPAGWKPVMPFEEWTSMTDICEHIFCRSTQVQMDSRRREWLARCHGAVPPPSPSSSLDSTNSGDQEYTPMEEEPGHGAPQAASVSPPPACEDLPPQSTPQCDMNENPAAAAAAAAAAVPAAVRGQSVSCRLPEPELPATDACVSDFVATAPSVAVGVGVGGSRLGWSDLTAGGLKPVPGSTPALPAQGSAVEPGLLGGELGMPEGEVRLTDEDLFDAAAVFFGGDGLLESDMLS
ncbi:unnamed protein product [Scytosiphon promiscuus]